MRAKFPYQAAAGRLIARTDANGTRITQTYNADGQLASIDYPNGKRVTYDWTCCRMASMTDDFGRSRFTYDVANRLVSAMDATGHLVLHRYLAGRRSALSLPDGSEYLYTYDTMGNLERIESTRSGQLSLFERNAARRLRSYTPVASAIEYTWGATALQVAANSLFTENYSIVDAQMPGQSPYQVETATFPLGSTADDELMVRRDLRVTAEEHTGGTEDMEYTYGYDPAGNRAEKINALASPDPTLLQNYFNSANQLMGVRTLPEPVVQTTLATPPNNVLVDKNGNTTQVTQPIVGGTLTWYFRYDYENRLIEARRFNSVTATQDTFEFGYDGLGRRVSTQVNQGATSWFIYDGGYLVQERALRSDDLIVEYGWGPTTGVPAIYYQHRVGAPDPDVWFFTSPQGGFPRYVIDAGDNIIDALQYSSFGELVFHDTAGTPSEIDFGWKGNWNALVDGESSLSLWHGTGIAFLPSMGSTLNGSMYRDDSIGGHTPPGTVPTPDPNNPHVDPDSTELPPGWYTCVVACSPPGPYRICMLAYCFIRSTPAGLNAGCAASAAGAGSAGGSGGIEGGTIGSSAGLDPGFGVPDTFKTNPGVQPHKDNAVARAARCKAAQFAERCKCLAECGPAACGWAGKWATKDAYATAASAVGNEGGEQHTKNDAFRHCYWACKMHVRVGAHCAQFILVNHEKTSAECSDPLNYISQMSRDMDMHNNKEGQKCGVSAGSVSSADVDKTCEQCCKQKADSNVLIWMYGPGGSWNGRAPD